MNQDETIKALAKLREPFPEHQISKLPKPTKQQTEEVKADFHKGIRCTLCGTWHHPKVVHLDYVGHAALTDRLLDTDPLWDWKPMAFDAEGLPKLDKTGGLWIYLTVCGVTRPGYGNAEGKTGGDAVKELIGDALRNAAMRFGAALELWHKGELHITQEEKPTPEQEHPEDEPQEHPSVNGWTIEAQEQFATLADRTYTAFRDAGKMDKYTAEGEKWRKRMATDTAEKVLPAMEAFVAKVEAAAKKSTEAADSQ